MWNTEFLMSITKNEAPHWHSAINVTRETQQPLPFEIVRQRPVWRMVSNMYITSHILNAWSRMASLIWSRSRNTGRHRARFSDTTPSYPSLFSSIQFPYSSELSIIQSRTEKGDSYLTSFPRINNAPLNDITENYLTTRFSMKCGFISPKCTWVSIAVQVKQNVISDVITL